MEETFGGLFIVRFEAVPGGFIDRGADFIAVFVLICYLHITAVLGFQNDLPVVLIVFVVGLRFLPFCFPVVFGQVHGGNYAVAAI